jgi:ABC-type polysaccharide/polyol phosphate export permease
MSTSIFVSNSRLMKSFPISPLTIIFSQIADNFINYVSAFLVLLLPIAFYTNWPMMNIFYLFLPLISLFIFVCSFCFLTAQINVFFRDTRFILNFLFQVGFFITPIFYPKSLVPKEMLWIVDFNIFYYLIRPFQILNFEFTTNEYFSSVGNSYIISFFLLFLSISFWRKNRNALYFKF